MSVLDVLLEGFDEAAHPRGFHGRFKAGDHVTLMHGMFGGVPARVTKVTGGRVHVTSPDSRVSDTSMTHNQAAVKLTPVSSSSRERGAAEVDAHMQAFKRGEVSRPRVRGDGRSGPIAPSAPALGHPDDPGNPNRQRARDAQLHSQTVRHLENLPQGRYLHVAGVANGGAIARRTAAGFEVYRANQARPDRVHKTPSAAAAHMVRIRKAGLAPVREAQPMVLGALLEGR